MLRNKKMASKKRSILVVVLIIVISGIGYLVYTNFFTTEVEVGQPIVKAKESVSITPGLETNIDDSFLDSSPYVKLKQHGKLPVTVDSIGRRNPFQPILLEF